MDRKILIEKLLEHGVCFSPNSSTSQLTNALENAEHSKQVRSRLWQHNPQLRQQFQLPYQG